MCFYLSQIQVSHFIATNALYENSSISTECAHIDKNIMYLSCASWVAVYSSTEVGKLQCFKWIKEHFNNSSPKFCAIGDSLDECEAAQALEWPFVKVDTAPTAPVRLPSLTLATIKRYMRIIYGDDVDIL